MQKNQTKNFQRKSIAARVVELDKIAISWNKTKDTKYYQQWYNGLKKLAEELPSLRKF
jgi:predicted HAD superfamily phosphohydrolase YqeG